MPGSTNFKVFDETMSGIMSDSTYSSSPTRMNGVSNGVADPTIHNKTLHQVSVMAAAFAQIAANLGNTVSDADLNALIQVIENSFSTIPYANSAANAGNIINQAFKGTADFGEILLCQKQVTPAAPTLTVGSSGVLNGTYYYEIVLLTGYQNADGSITVTGMAPGTESASISTSNQSIQLTGIPLGTSGTVGRAIYRTISGGSNGTEKFLTIIPDNSTTTYADNVADSNLGTVPTSVNGSNINGNIPSALPTANTTGSYYYSQNFAPTFVNGWKNANSATLTTAGYRKDSNGNVRLRGCVNGGQVGSANVGSACIMFYLPENFRPTIGRVFAVGTGTDNLVGEVVVNTNGAVFANHPTTSGWNYLSLDGVCFETY